MLIFYGDCNSAAIANTKFFSSYGINTESRLLPTPANFAKDTFKCPIELWEKIKEFSLDKFLNPATFEYQFSAFSESCDPEMFVIVIGHEYRPIYYNKHDRYYFWIDTRALDENDDFKQWFTANFDSAFLDPDGYAKRVIGMIEAFLYFFPNIPITIVSKISPSYLFGPFLYTHFQNWNVNFSRTMASLRNAIKKLNNVYFLEIDRIVSGLILRDKISINRLIPNIMKIDTGCLNGVNQFGGNYIYMRDLDHLHPCVYEVCASKIYEIMNKGNVHYDSSEVDLHNLDSTKIKKIEASIVEIQNMLSSNDANLFNNGLEYLIDKEDDFSNLVLQALTNGKTVFDQYIVQGLKAYFSIKKCSQATQIVDALINMLSKESKKIKKLDYKNLMFEVLELKRIAKEIELDNGDFEKQYVQSMEAEDFLLTIRKSKKIGIYGIGHYGKLLGKYLNNISTIVFFDDNREESSGDTESVLINEFSDSLDMLVVTPSDDTIATSMLARASSANSNVLTRIPEKIYRILDTKYANIIMNNNFHFICNSCKNKEKQGLVNIIYLEKFKVIGTKCSECGHEVEFNFNTCVEANEF